MIFHNIRLSAFFHSREYRASKIVLFNEGQGAQVLTLPGQLNGHLKFYNDINSSTEGI